MSTDQRFKIMCVDNANTPDVACSLTSGDVARAIECRLRACGDLRKVAVEELGEKLTSAQADRMRFKMEQWANYIDEIVQSEVCEMSKGAQLNTLANDIRSWRP